VIAARRCLDPRNLHAIPAANLPYALAVNKYALAINVYAAQAITVDGPSMQPNLYYDYRVMVKKITYRFFHGPRRGDVVVVDMPGEETLIKRVVALPGETVEVRGNRSLPSASSARPCSSTGRQPRSNRSAR